MSKVASVPDGKTNPGFKNSPSAAELGSQPSAIYTVQLVSVSSKVPLDASSQQLAENGSGPPDYDPYQFRTVKHPTTNIETWLHLVKGSLGTGILAMPNAFKNSGYWPGLVGTILIGIICTYCIHMLVRSSYELCRRKRVGSLNYANTAEEAMRQGPGFLPKIAPFAGHIVNTFMFVYQLGTCCVYVVFVASSIQIVCNYYFDDLSIQLYMTFILLPLIMINFIRNLKLLAPFSTAANAVTIGSFGITLYYVFRDGLPPVGEREPFGTLEGYPLFFGTVLFALEAIGVIMPLENNMKTPRSFGGAQGVLNKAMVCIITLYAMLGLFGYLKYGDAVLGSITLNLPVDEVLAQMVQVMLALAIFISYALQCYVAVDIVWNIYVSPRVNRKSYRLIAEFCVRLLLVLISFSLAIAIPNLELFISLFGALCLSILGIVLPAIIEAATFEHQRRGWRLAKNIFLVVFGLLGLVTGTYISLKDIIETFFH